MPNEQNMLRLPYEYLERLLAVQEMVKQRNSQKGMAPVGSSANLNNQTAMDVYKR